MRKFEDRKRQKKEIIDITSKENNILIRTINNFGKIPETSELLDEIDRLNNIIDELEKYIIENKQGYIIRSDKLLDKLKELKENNNEN